MVIWSRTQEKHIRDYDGLTIMRLQPDFQITKICVVLFKVLYLSIEAPQWNTYDHKHTDETKQRTL